MAKKIICIHCGAEVWWGMPRPEDPCAECFKPIALDVEEDDDGAADAKEGWYTAMELLDP